MYRPGRQLWEAGALALLLSAGCTGRIEGWSAEPGGAAGSGAGNANGGMTPTGMGGGMGMGAAGAGGTSVTPPPSKCLPGVVRGGLRCGG
jgi:hypothetical protein